MTEVGSGKGHCFLASDVSLESKIPSEEKERSEIVHVLWLAVIMHIE